MTGTWCIWLGTGSVALLTLGALGSRLLNEMAWHELKEYCRRRQNSARFDLIHDEHDQVLLGLETLRHLATGLLLVAAVGWSTDRMHQGLANDRGQILWAVLGVGALLVVLGSWLPAAISRLWAAPVLFHCWRIFHVASRLVWPFSLGALLAEAFLRRIAAQPRRQTEEEAFEDEIRTIVTEGLRDGHLEADAREMIEGVIELDDNEVADIMTPRSEVDALSVDLDWDQTLQFVTRVGRTRFPVYDDSLDEIVGILYVKDLLAQLARPAEERTTSLRSLLRQSTTVPMTRKLDDLLQDFLQTRNHLAIVVDEYNATAGIVTIEDVLEEIVGEIVDESDQEAVGEIQRIDEYRAEVQGRAHLAEVNELLGTNLPDPDDFDTIGGLVVSRLGRIPETGDVLEGETFRITVLEASRRKVERVLLESRVSRSGASVPMP